jgi:hypothetical protein
MHPVVFAYTDLFLLAMGAPTSAILAQVCIQYLEHITVIDILKKFQIIDYHRYVDNILIKSYTVAQLISITH